MRHYGRVVVSLAAAACMLFGGVANVNAATGGRTDTPVTLSNVRVERSGESIANVSFDYAISPDAIKNGIKGACFSVDVTNYTAVTPVREDPDEFYSSYINSIYGYNLHPECSTDDLGNDGRLGDYEAHVNQPFTLFWKPEEVFSRVDGQNYTQYHSITWDGKLTGHQTIAIPGLESGVGYTNNKLGELNQYDGLTVGEGWEDAVSPESYVRAYSDYLYEHGVRTKSPTSIQSVVLSATIADDGLSVYNWICEENDGQKFLEIPATPSVSFRDVDASTPHADDIKWTASAGISTGWIEPDGTRTFRGMDTVKRQDMAAFLRCEAVRMGISDAAAWKPSAGDWAKFRDVDRSTPHAEDILWLTHSGIAQGYSDGTFRGMTPVYRQDMAAFLHRLASKGGKGEDVEPRGFRDVTDSTPHADDIRWLGGSGVSTGYPDGSFGGMVSVYRQDMAAFLHRLDSLS